MTYSGMYNINTSAMKKELNEKVILNFALDRVTDVINTVSRSMMLRIIDAIEADLDRKDAVTGIEEPEGIYCSEKKHESKTLVKVNKAVEEFENECMLITSRMVDDLIKLGFVNK